ncbi:MAG: hypothetical protein WD271_07905 [Acidimicrobiia bacterium]
MPADATGEMAMGEMAGHGVYDQHSLAQHSAGSYGMPLLERAVGEIAQIDPGAGPIVIADFGAAGGRNELAPMATAINGLRAGGVTQPIVVVHTDIPTNDFTTLFETIEQSPNTYLHAPDVFAFAAGRSFYERIFPPETLTFGWSAIAVHWLSHVPVPIPDHVYCSFASGDARAALVRQSADDWDAFLTARAAELRPGAQLVVVGGAATDDGASGAESLMTALNDSLRDAVSTGTLTEDEYRQMTVPTWNRTIAEFAAPFESGGGATTAGLTLVEQSLARLPDQYLPAYLSSGRSSGDAGAFADSVSAFLRAFTEPSLIETLNRGPEARAEIADAVFANVRSRLAAEPATFETTWRVALLRILRAPATRH